MSFYIRTPRRSLGHQYNKSETLRHSLSYLFTIVKDFSSGIPRTLLYSITTYLLNQLQQQPLSVLHANISSMYVTRIPTKIPISKQTATQLSKAVASFSQHGVLTQTPGLHLTLPPAQSRRQFSSTSRTRLRDYFPEAEHDHQIQKTDPAWPHPSYVLAYHSCVLSSLK